MHDSCTREPRAHKPYIFEGSARFEVYIGINEPYFVEAMKDVPYYVKLRKKRGDINV